MSEGELQAKYDELAGRVKGKAAELQTCKEELSGVVARLVDANTKDRPGLIARRGELVNLRDILTDELKVLQTRRDAAQLAIYVYRVEQTQAEMARLVAIATEKRQALTLVNDEITRFHNRGGGWKPGTDDLTLELARLESNYATTKAESVIAGRNAYQASQAAKAANEELEEVKKQLGIIP